MVVDYQEIDLAGREVRALRETGAAASRAIVASRPSTLTPPAHDCNRKSRDYRDLTIECFAMESIELREIIASRDEEIAVKDEIIHASFDAISSQTVIIRRLREQLASEREADRALREAVLLKAGADDEGGPPV